MVLDDRLPDSFWSDDEDDFVYDDDEESEEEPEGMEESESESDHGDEVSEEELDTDEEREIRLSRPEMVYPTNQEIHSYFTNRIQDAEEVYINGKIYVKCSVLDIYYDQRTNVTVAYYELEHALIDAGIIRPFVNSFTVPEVNEMILSSTALEMNRIGQQLAYNLVLGFSYTVLQYKFDGKNFSETSRFYSLYYGYRVTDRYLEKADCYANIYLFYDGWNYCEVEIEDYSMHTRQYTVILETLHQHLKDLDPVEGVVNEEYVNEIG